MGEIMTTATTTRLWCDIAFTDEEWTRWQTGKESIRTTINNILESGLPLLEAVHSGKTLTTDENAIMKRVEQVVKAAFTHPMVYAECSEPLLQAFAF